MPSNVEIKARLEDFDVFHTLFKKVYQPKVGKLAYLGGETQKTRQSFPLPNQA